MNHYELQTLIDGLVSPEFAAYMFGWVEDGHPSSAFLSLIPKGDGTVTAARGDLRTKVEPWVDETGRPLVFADESSACEWAWNEIQLARQDPPPQSAEERARTLANGEEKRKLWEERLRRWEAEGV